MFQSKAMASPKFWQSVLLYLTRPNLIDRRFIGAELVNIWTFAELSPSIDEASWWENQTIDKIVEQFHMEPFKLIDDFAKKLDLNSLLHGDTTNFFIVRKYFPKKTLKTLQREAESSSEQSAIDSDFDIAILSPSLNSFTIVPIHLADNRISIKTEDNVGAFTFKFEQEDIEATYLFANTSNFFGEKLREKLKRWMMSSDDALESDSNEVKGSIQAISVERYCATYNRLKTTYSLQFLEMWNKAEKTDPIKFIYEDIAIAAYLITLWEEEREKHNLTKYQTFLDVGCGNGLLVYLLSNEGYSGCGIDVRRRNIWQHYGDGVHLIEMRIDLFAANVVDTLPSCDWMIGNHSDELTPWIIYLAANKSPTTRAFILPCCCYDFDGFKYQRIGSGKKSQYHSYLDFLYQLANDFGFKCVRDKLRIPSTKRLCLVCNERNYLDSAQLLKHDGAGGDENTFAPMMTKADGDGDVDGQQQQQQQKQQQLLSEEGIKLKRKSIVDGRLQMRSNLRLRERQEAVRNCTRIDQKVKEAIIERLAFRLIHANRQDGLTFGEAIHLLDDEMRSNLKKQCGGLQTFVRNHRHIFTIANQRIRFQRVEQLRHQAGKTKTRQCWFYFHHPDKCQLDDKSCAYLHV